MKVRQLNFYLTLKNVLFPSCIWVLSKNDTACVITLSQEVTDSGLKTLWFKCVNNVVVCFIKVPRILTLFAHSTVSLTFQWYSCCWWWRKGVSLQDQFRIQTACLWKLLQGVLAKMLSIWRGKLFRLFPDGV